MDSSDFHAHQLETSKPFIKFKNVFLELQSAKLLSKLNCEISSHGTTVLMGPNGAGKSLFLKILAGLLQPTKGKITFNEPNQRPVLVHEIAILFQQPILLRRSTYQNIAFVLSRQNSSKKNLDENINAALANARLLDRADTSARLLSGGERQRLALARALVTNPKLLLMDEITASLDPASVHIVEKMSNNASNSGTKIVLITHDIRQAKRIADDIIFMHQGQILIHKNAREFFINPGSDEAQAYLDGRIPDQLKLP